MHEYIQKFAFLDFITFQSIINLPPPLQRLPSSLSSPITLSSLVGVNMRGREGGREQMCVWGSEGEADHRPHCRLS